MADQPVERHSDTDNDLMDRDEWGGHHILSPDAGTTQRYLPDPAQAGQRIECSIVTGGGGTIEIEHKDGDAINHAGNTKATFASGGWIVFESFQNIGETAYEWRITGQEGAVLS